MNARSARRARDAAQTTIITPLETDKPFYAYLVLTVAQFLNVGKLVPGLGIIRPTVLSLGLTCIYLYLSRDQLKGRLGDPVSRRLLLLLGYIGVSLPFVTFPGSVLRANLEVFVLAIGFFFLTALVVDSERRLRLFVWTFLACQFVRVLDPVRRHLMYGYWGSQTFVGPGEFANRLSSAPWDTVNPNGYAFVIVTTFIFAHFLMLSSPRRIAKIAYLVSVPVMLYALELTASRTGLVVLLVALIGIFIYSKRRGLMIAVMAIGATVAVANMSSFSVDRYMSLIDSTAQGRGTVEGRIGGALTEFRLFRQKPVFGTGLGTSGEARFHFTGRNRIAHNMYLETLIELGIVGFAIFLSVLAAIIASAREAARRVDKALRQEGNSPNRLYHAQLGKALKVWFAACAIFSLAHYGLSSYPWYLFAGLMVAYSRVVAQSTATPGAAIVPPEETPRGRRRNGRRTKMPGT